MQCFLNNYSFMWIWPTKTKMSNMHKMIHFGHALPRTLLRELTTLLRTPKSYMGRASLPTLPLDAFGGDSISAPAAEGA